MLLFKMIHKMRINITDYHFVFPPLRNRQFIFTYSDKFVYPHPQTRRQGLIPTRVSMACIVSSFLVRRRNMRKNQLTNLSLWPADWATVAMWVIVRRDLLVPSVSRVRFVSLLHFMFSTHPSSFSQAWSLQPPWTTRYLCLARDVRMRWGRRRIIGIILGAAVGDMRHSAISMRLVNLKLLSAMFGKHQFPVILLRFSWSLLAGRGL